MASAKIVGSFQIDTAGNRTTDEVVAAGKYDERIEWVNNKNFPMRPMPEGPRKIVLIEFCHDTDAEEVLAEATLRGLECPRYEDVLFFGEQYPEEQRKMPIIFLHEPWQDLPGILGMLVLRCDVGQRKLCIVLSKRNLVTRWNRHLGQVCFAFVSK